jgi:hypothetical protein
MTQTIHDVIFGQSRDDRACGDCIACCQVLNIDEPELVKPQGTLCPNCTGSGCAIYDTRPGVCRSWNCAWKRIVSMPPQTRPDTMGVLFTVDRHMPPRNLFENLYIIAVAQTREADLNSRPTLDAVSMFTAGPLPIFVQWQGMKTLVHPEPVLADAIMHPTRVKDPRLLHTARQWLQRYAPFARAGAEDQVMLPKGI